MALFAHLALQFGSHPENLATEGLGYILQGSVAARRGFMFGLGGGDAVSSSELRFETQVYDAHQGRPDLVGFDTAGEKALLVEAKFDAGFTELQPVNYLQQLRADGTLLVVGPAKRLPYLWQELLRRLREANLPFEVKTAPGESGEVAIGNRRLLLWSWYRVLHSLELELSGEPETLADVVQLRGLCARMDNAAFVPVTSAELTGASFRRVHEFGTIVDTIADKLAAEKRFNMKRLRSAASNGWYGRYAWLHGIGVLLHVNTRNWAALAPTPLWLNVYGTAWTKSPPEAVKKQIAPYENENPGSVHLSRDGFPTVALRVAPGQERHDIVASVSAQIMCIGKLLEPMGAALKEHATAPEPDAETPEA